MHSIIYLAIAMGLSIVMSVSLHLEAKSFVNPLVV